MENLKDNKVSNSTKGKSVAKTQIEKLEPKETVATKPKVEKKEEVKKDMMPQRVQARKIDMDELIRVVSLKTNSLIYLSKTQVGYQIEWDEYGSEQWVEYRELITMKNSQTAFFKKNWIICDMDVLQALKVDQYYKDMIDLEDIESIFANPLDKLEQIISVSSAGIKQLIFDKALQMYKEDRLDSIKVIGMLKDKFNYDLELVK
jgi:hypothetical protein